MSRLSQRWIQMKIWKKTRLIRTFLSVDSVGITVLASKIHCYHLVNAEVEFNLCTMSVLKTGLTQREIAKRMPFLVLTILSSLNAKFARLHIHMFSRHRVRSIT